VKGLLPFHGPSFGNQSQRIFALSAFFLAANLISVVASILPTPSPWTFITTRELQSTASKPQIQPEMFQAVRVDYTSLNTLLNRVEAETPEQIIPPAILITLPMPDGSLARFRVIESPVMAPELAAQFPQIKTYRGQGVDDSQATLRLDVTPAGVHAQILSPRGAIYIDPYWQGNRDVLASYYKRDYQKAANDFTCQVLERTDANAPRKTLSRTASGGTLRTYRLACAATAEYTAFHGGTVEAGQAAIVTAINRVTGVYEQELDIRLVLVANNSLLVFTNSETDPYTNDDGSALLDENQSTVDSIIGSANYDIGHVFSTGGGGLASLGVVCNDAWKARGMTGNATPTGDGFWIDYVAHEIGHQFGANHTFNGSMGSCSGNRVGSVAYEPGSGSTIMAYAGICDADDLQPHSDPYFHFASYEEIMTYTTSGDGASCPSSSATGNNPPTIGALTNYTIPSSTPFLLTASGNDPDGDPLTFCWEEADLGPSISLLDGDNGSSPLFRSFAPTTDMVRIFPRLSEILNNTSSTVERLPTTTRDMNFKVTARDHRSGGGGVNSTSIVIHVTSNAGPFRIISPNTTQTLSGPIIATWQVAGTTNAPVNCTAVDLLLSTDGGLTYPILLATNTPNDGAEIVRLPYLTTNQARLKIQARNNIFFDVSDTNFNITPGSPLIIDHAVFSDAAGNGNGVMEPGEQIEETIVLKNAGNESLTGITAVVSTAKPGITMLQDSSTYPDIAAGALSTNATPFRYRLAKNISCGSSLAYSIIAFSPHSDSTDIWSRAVGLSQYGSPQTGTFESVDVPAFIADLTDNLSLLSIPVTGLVEDIDVHLRINHAYDGDLQIHLLHPDDTEVMLSNQRGGSGQNYGSGDCLTGTRTTFDDSAATPIASGVAPFTGSYSPENPLSAFNGKVLEGTWTLSIYDTWGADPGTTLCWSVQATYRPQETICSIYDQAPVITEGSVLPASPTTTQDLTTVSTASDPDDDPVSIAYLWQSSTDGISFAATGNTASNYPAASTMVGWYYRCVMIPSDGYLNGGSWTTTSVRVQLDSDNDQLNDDWEMEWFHSLYAESGGGDADSDHFLNVDELLAGTDPTNEQSCLKMSMPPALGGAGGIVVRWQSVTGRMYTLSRSTNLVLPVSFSVVQTNIAGQAGNTVRTDATATARGPYLYRVETKP
jgi:subtilisin-like proprotein convertase family protein